jgi:hypothetical protein
LTHWQYFFDGVPIVYIVATIIHNVGLLMAGKVLIVHGDETVIVGDGDSSVAYVV